MGARSSGVKVSAFTSVRLISIFVICPWFFQVWEVTLMLSHTGYIEVQAKTWDRQIWMPTRYYRLCGSSQWLLGKHPLLTNLGW